jgi:hypothetical protein
MTRQADPKYGHDQPAGIMNVAKSTRVYAKINGTWKLVHANFAPMSGDDD